MPLHRVPFILIEASGVGLTAYCQSNDRLGDERKNLMVILEPKYSRLHDRSSQKVNAAEFHCPVINILVACGLNRC
jgi:hypothetical protein